MAVQTACKKGNTIGQIDEVVDETNTASVKYFNFSTGSPSVNFYANGIKVAGVLSATGAESTSGINFGAVYPSANYSIIADGTYSITAKTPVGAPKIPNTTIATINQAFNKGKFYSLYTSGIYDTLTKTTDAFVIEDKLPAVNSSLAYVRFVNAISNGTGAMNLVAKNVNTGLETTVATNVAYKNVSDFVTLPNGIYELYVRYPNSSANLISRNATTNGTVSLQGGRTYTVGTRGDLTITSSTAINRPLLDVSANR